MSSPLPDQLLNHIRAAGLFPEPGRAIVAVSGGPDSMALALLLRRIAPRLRLALTIAHVDHGIHADSGRVASMVRGFADQIGVSVVSEQLRLGGGTSETEARRMRYVALRRMQEEANGRYLVTAHHADDQIETVLLRFLRGSGMAGLSGIPSVGPSGLVRPLLPFHKKVIAQWLRQEATAAGLEFDVHSDPSNVDPAHDRSWVREVILPLVVERFRGRVGPALLGVARNAAEDREAWSAVLRELPDLRFARSGTAVQVARDTLRQYDPELSLALLRAAARETGCVLGPEKARQIWSAVRDAPSGRTFELGLGWVLETVFDDLRIRSIDGLASSVTDRTEVWGQPDGGEIRWGEWSIAWRVDDAEPAHRVSMVTWCTPGAGRIRAPRPGDRIRPLGGLGRRKLSRVLMEGKVPWPERREYPVLVRGNNILWLPGICRSDCDVPEAGEAAVRIDARCG